MLLTRVREGIGWRWRLSRRNRFLRRQFHNGKELIQSYASKRSCQTAVCHDGMVIRHPDRSGLAQTILEIWYDQIYTRNFYEPKPGDVLIDGGANIGLFSLWAARTCPGCRVLAFEPFAENYRLLESNLSAAKSSAFEAFHAGLAGSSGYAVMRDGGTRSLDHRMEMIADATPDDSGIRTYSFSDVVRLAGGAVSLFKCDIEGSEYKLFEYASDADLRAVSKYAIEYHDNLCPGTLDLLRRRLAPTHDVVVRPDGQYQYGMIYAATKSPA